MSAPRRIVRFLTASSLGIGLAVTGLLWFSGSGSAADRSVTTLAGRGAPVAVGSDRYIGHGRAGLAPLQRVSGFEFGRGGGIEVPRVVYGPTPVYRTVRDDRRDRAHSGRGPLGKAHRRGSIQIIGLPAERRSTFTYGTGVLANSNYPAGIPVSPGGSAPSLFGDDVSPPKRIEVASARLDRMPYGPDGIAVHRVGSAKIIRIDPGYGTGRATIRNGQASPREAEDRPVAALGPQPYRAPQAAAAEPVATVPARVPVPTPSPAAGATSQDTASEPPLADAAPRAERLEPWTDAWLQDCVARHEGFDASLGTYTDADGRRRFCTGEEN